MHSFSGGLALYVPQYQEVPLRHSIAQEEAGTWAAILHDWTRSMQKEAKKQGAPVH